MLTSEPLLTKSLTSSLIMSLSDVFCQEIINKSQSVKDLRPGSSRLNLQRTFQVAITGLLWSGPITHFWYALLERMYSRLAEVFPIQNPAIAMLVKLFLDAILFSPTVVTGYFIIRSLLEGGDWMISTKDKMRTKFKPTLLNAWKFWPAVNSINFYFVPLQFRVLYMNALSLLWSGYLTHVNSTKSKHRQK
ncbi:Mpv17 / PMP22 family protein [Nitzschia inconspicua]|uniref:Mpv17 / PMP22 family protein n=1 Tax=Nitzschia inconspicua TaxID=303405 RepID=A0A9K3L2K8_9STRA|nr:Mpv17 / PMP22 family protein [Nitzschia inconspicua]